LLEAGRQLPKPSGLLEIRDGLENQALALPKRPASDVEVRDIEAPGPAGPIPVRLYVPSASSPPPLTIFLHGGGFVAGSISTHDHVCRDLAKAGSTAVISVGYRLAPEHPYPAGLDDALAVVRWAALEGRALGVDADRLAIAGDSAGATFAIATAMRLRDDGGPGLVAQLLLYPSADLVGEDYPSRVENAEGYGLTEMARRQLTGLYAPTAELKANPLISPLLAQRLGGLPETLIVTCEFDPLRDEGIKLAQLLADAGTKTAHRNAPGMIHGFVNYSGVSPVAAAIFDEAACWLGERLEST
jgi:acetyl esterase